MVRLEKLLDFRIALLISIALSLFLLVKTQPLRTISVSVIPESNIILDEFSYAWQGISIWGSGIPVGWSDIGAYEKGAGGKTNVGTIDGLKMKVAQKETTLNDFADFPKPAVATYKTDTGSGDKYYRFVTPYIDHPPLGGLIYSLGIPTHIKSFSEIKPEHFRSLNFFIVPLTSILLFILSLQISKNPYLAFLSLAFYLTIPTFIFGTRYALLENILAPFSLLSLNLILLSKNTKSYKLSLVFLVLGAIAAGLMMLVKIAGIGFLVSFIVLLFYWKTSRKRVLIFSGISLFITSLYFWWGLWLSPNLFLDLMFYQGSSRFYGSLSFLTQVFQLRFENFPLDGWWIWGFITLIFLAFLEKDKFLPLILPPICYLITVALLGGPNHAWFYLTLFPYLAAACAWSIFKIITNPNLPLLISFILIPFSSSLYWGYFVFHQPPQILIYRLGILFILSLGLFKIFRNSKNINFLWVAILVFLTYQLIKWNIYGDLFIIANWANLPIPSLPRIY